MFFFGAAVGGTVAGAPNWIVDVPGKPVGALDELAGGLAGLLAPKPGGGNPVVGAAVAGFGKPNMADVLDGIAAPKPDPDTAPPRGGSAVAVGAGAVGAGACGRPKMAGFMLVSPGFVELSPANRAEGALTAGATDVIRPVNAVLLAGVSVVAVADSGNAGLGTPLVKVGAVIVNVDVETFGGANPAKIEPLPAPPGALARLAVLGGIC